MFIKIKKIDVRIINRLRKLEVPLARMAIFVVYFWFGLLKLIGASPAISLVQSLFEKTIHFVPFTTFYIFFSIFEIIIGLLFLIRGFERQAIFLLFLHLIATTLPLIFLPQITWQTFLVPTLEGQYIIKNLVIIAAAMGIGAQLDPLSESR